MYQEQRFNSGGNRGGFGGGNNRGSFGGGSGPIAPVKVGETLDVKIEAVGEKGDGIAKKNGFVIFVPGGKAGETVHVKITRVLKKMAFSEIAGPAVGGNSDEDSQESSGYKDKAPKEEAPEEDFSGEDSDSFGEEDSQEEEKFD